MSKAKLIKREELVPCPACKGGIPRGRRILVNPCPHCGGGGWLKKK